MPAPVVELWGRLAEPIPHGRAVEALLGLSHGAVELLQGALLVMSPQAGRLLAELPKISRSMAVSTTDRPQRTVGHVRGPILWSETIAARAASFGDEGVFVCQATLRAYDTAENRVLAHALKIVVDAAKAVETHRAAGQWNELAVEIRDAGNTAQQFLEHRTLQNVPRGRPTGRDVRRARSGHRRRTYQPAFELLERAAVPFEATDVEGVTDPLSDDWHRLLLRVLTATTERGHVVPRLRVDTGVVLGGPVSFRHPKHRGTVDHPHGISVGSLLLHPAGKEPGPELGDHQAIEVSDDQPLDPLLERAGL